MESSNNRISDLIESQVPRFVRDDHPGFVSFLEAYYEYLESTDKALYHSNRLLAYRDIDETTNEFAEHLYSEFIKALPKDIAADKRIILKHVKDFYRSRGSEKSLKFLVRIITGEEVEEIYYPKNDVLRASDGKWYIQKSVRVSNTSVNGISNTNLSGLQLFVNRRITGNTSNASATVERVDRFFEQGTLINELILSNMKGSFDSNEMIYTTFDNYYVNTTILSNSIEGFTINNPGSQYGVGDPLTFESNTGIGAIAQVSRVSTGNISNITIVFSGAGFKVNDALLFSGSDGSGANARVLSVDDSNYYHKNTINIYTTTVGDMAGQNIMSNYVNVNTTIVSSPNANTTLADALVEIAYGPTGPIDSVFVANVGSGYSIVPTITVSSSAIVRSLGILGRMEIVSGGINYTAGDTIEFINIPGGIGTGALANVRNVDANGTITRVEFLTVPGFYPGGVGYSQSYLPTTNVVTSTGNSANIIVKAILGDGEVLEANTGTIGQILGIDLINPGSGYDTAPTINMSSYGDGTANITANIIAGLFTYPGRYLNDDGHLSSSNYLQNRDYYQNFSYEVRVKADLIKYRSALLSLVHPSGMIHFAEHISENTIPLSVSHTSNTELLIE